MPGGVSPGRSILSTTSLKSPSGLNGLVLEGDVERPVVARGRERPHAPLRVEPVAQIALDVVGGVQHPALYPRAVGEEQPRLADEVHVCRLAVAVLEDEAVSPKVGRVVQPCPVGQQEQPEALARLDLGRRRRRPGGRALRVGKQEARLADDAVCTHHIVAKGVVLRAHAAKERDLERPAVARQGLFRHAVDERGVDRDLLLEPGDDGGQVAGRGRTGPAPASNAPASGAASRANPAGRRPGHRRGRPARSPGSRGRRAAPGSASARRCRQARGGRRRRGRRTRPPRRRPARRQLLRHRRHSG